VFVPTVRTRVLSWWRVAMVAAWSWRRSPIWLRRQKTALTDHPRSTREYPLALADAPEAFVDRGLRDPAHADI